MLYLENYKTLYSVAIRMLPDQEAAHDVVMDLMVDVVRRPHFFRSKTMVPAYLVKAVINRSLNLIQRRKIERERILPLLNEPHSTYASQPGAALERTELNNALREAMTEMPRKTRSIFILHRRFKWKYRQIAVHLGISIKTVEKHMSVALKALRRVASG